VLHAGSGPPHAPSWLRPGANIVCTLGAPAEASLALAGEFETEIRPESRVAVEGDTRSSQLQTLPGGPTETAKRRYSRQQRVDVYPDNGGRYHEIDWKTIFGTTSRRRCFSLGSVGRVRHIRNGLIVQHCGIHGNATIEPSSGTDRQGWGHHREPMMARGAWSDRQGQGLCRPGPVMCRRRHGQGGRQDRRSHGVKSAWLAHM